MTTAPTAPPSPSGVTDPAGPAADLTVLAVLDRALLGEVRRLARLAEGVAAGTVPVTERRALAVADHVERVCEAIRHRHEAEEDLLWVLLTRHAGRALDLSGLRDDHVALRGLLGEVRRGMRGVVAALMLRSLAVATAADFARMRTLAEGLAELAELLDEHVRDTGRELAAVSVPADAWHRGVRALLATAPDRAGIAVRLRATATPGEVAAVDAALGRAGTFARHALRRRERLVFGE
ncbi:hypothetical protein GCM10023200_50400 [Actinomycetospora chlora]|uniref:Hemerythrin-like domain-containing protein n=1 Tax=Actinomycetospora chlora TaxID=663608 RepID=A0ABP9CE54_9PSEU